MRPADRERCRVLRAARRVRPRAALTAPLAAALVLVLAAALMAGLAGVARADGGGYPNCPPGSTPDPTLQSCIITVASSSAPAAPSASGGSGGGPAPTCSWVAPRGQAQVPVPCTNAQYGSWNQTLMCYFELASPQPAAGDPAWEGHQPGDGAIWQAACPISDAGGVLGFETVNMWFAAPPVGPDPAALAAQAAAQMTMRAPAITIAPPGGRALVGAPVWLWDAKSAETWGPQTVTVTAGGLSVSATSQVTDLSWDLGDGSVLNCPDGGTPYQAADGALASPDCGHIYAASSADQPGGTYTVTGTSTWTLTWSASDGQAGTLTFHLSDTITLAVLEGQAVSAGGTQ